MLSIDFKEGIIKAAPIAGAAGADVATRFAGLSMSDWFYIAVITYTIAQTAVMIFKTIKDEKRKDKQEVCTHEHT